MPLKTDTTEEASLNLTPMIDIVFLLIIFFMVGTQFAQMERQYDIKLPTVSTAPPLTSLPDEIVINVRSNGEIVVSKQVLTANQLKQTLREAKQNYADQAVVIRGEGQGQYQHVINVMAICHEAKINSISLAHHLRQGDE